MALLRTLFRRSNLAASTGNDGARERASEAITQSTTEDVARQIHRLAESGDWSAALRRADEALASAPDDADLVLARASTLFEWGRHREALPEFFRAENLGSTNYNLYLRAGWASMGCVGAVAAEAWMRKAVSAEPREWTAHFGLASALRGQGRIEEAAKAFEQALELSPGNVNCLTQLSECMLAQKEPVRAETYARRALEQDESVPFSWSNVGVTLIAQERFDEATAAFEHAGRLEEQGAGISDANFNLAMCLREAGRLDESLALYDRKLRTLPFPATSTHYAHALLIAGRLREGFRQYEFRWFHAPLLQLRPSFRKPVWSGQDLRGKTILLRTEQGIGDVIQFIRYAPHVKALGAKVILQLRTGLGALAAALPGVDHIPKPEDPYPEFDYYIHLMSLARVFGTDLATVPSAVPYLRTDPGKRAQWHARLANDAGLKVGLVWAGDPSHVRDRYRSIALEALAPLAQVQGVQFYSLQKGAAAAQMEVPPDGMRITDLGPELDDFSDTAALLETLDLLISVDTSVAHLAGALGRPVWLLTPTPPEWRWMTGRDDSPWYPTMRLFRQARQGEWRPVVERMTDALAVAVAATENIEPPRSLEPEERPLLPVDDDIPEMLRGLTAVAETAMGIVQYFPDDVPIGPSIRGYGEYLRDQCNSLAERMKPGDVVIEVEAGIGAHALALAPAIGPRGHLILYESRARMQQVLRQNLAANGIGNTTVMKRPLAGRSPRPAGANKPVPDSTGTPAATETIDELRLAKLDWIKTGEAADPLAVLEGASDTLWRLRPSLFLAVADTQAAMEVAERARDHGYTCWTMTTDLFNPSNFNCLDTDIFSGQTALAVVAIPEEHGGRIAFEGCEPIS